MSAEVFAVLLAAIQARRLVLFTGAGLSMAAPSNLPSARVLAERCAARHEAQTEERLKGDLVTNIEAQARLFWHRKSLESYFLESLIDWAPFHGEPNSGHMTVADFLLCGAIDLNVTANVDVLVERAAEVLGSSTVTGAVCGSEAATPRSHQPLLKIHGCVRRNHQDSLWCAEQLTETTWRERIADSSRWLSGRLVQRDLVFIGYWTDWDYLNTVFTTILSDLKPRSVTLVDPAPSDALAAKAPGLWEWAHRDSIAFYHVQQSGSEFLEELRHRFSRILLRSIAGVGDDAYTHATTAPPPPFPSLDSLTVEDLYDLRRDWEGVSRAQAAKRRNTQQSDQVLGRTFHELIAAGAAFEGSYLVLRGKRIRLVQGAGQMLYALRTAIGSDIASFDSPDITICAGADDDGGVPADIVRPSRRATVVRPGTTSEWCTHTTLRQLIDSL